MPGRGSGNARKRRRHKTTVVRIHQNYQTVTVELCLGSIQQSTTKIRVCNSIKLLQIRVWQLQQQPQQLAKCTASLPSLFQQRAFTLPSLYATPSFTSATLGLFILIEFLVEGLSISVFPVEESARDGSQQSLQSAQSQHSV